MFLQSSSQIYSKMQMEGLAARLATEDYYTIFGPLLTAGLGYHWDHGRIVMRPMSEPVLQAETPWVHVKGTPTKNCGLDHQISFNLFSIIPPRCQDCWKICVTPTTFKQLMELLEVEKEMQVPSKCGIELRDYTPKFYGGYYYTNSFEEGRERYEQVRKAVDKGLTDGKNVSIILKRGCTEFEILHGPSHFWHNTIEQEKMLELIDAFVDYPRGQQQQPEIVQKHAILKWILWAFMNADHTYEEFNGGKPLYKEFQKYHEGDIDDIKHDLAVAHAMVRTGATQETVDDFLVLSQKFADEHKIADVGVLGNFLGYQTVDPFILRKINLQKVVPDKLKGEESDSV